MHSFWNFFIHKKQFTMLLLAAVSLWGVFAVARITKESAPEVQIPIAVISTVLPGASAEDVERLVTNKIEERLATIENLDTLTSTSRNSLSVVVVQFTANANLDKSIQKAKDLVDKAKPDLPSEAKDPSVTDVNFVDQPVQVISVSADVTGAKLAELGESVKSELQTIPGVQKVSISGARSREIDVVVKKEEIARLGISLPQVVSAIGAANASLPVGAITVDNVNYNIAFNGSLDHVSDIGSIALLTVGGQVVYLRDIADVSDSIEKATTYSRVSTNGKPSEQSLTFNIFKVRGQDVTAVTAAVKTKLAQLQQTLLRGSQVVVSLDSGEQVRKDLVELTRTGIESIILVMLALFATIGWRESIIAGLSIPLSFLIAFIGLYYSGNTLNFVSLFSLILAIGILVDSGIVVVEAIHTRIRKFGNKEMAAYEAIREYSWPLIGGTFTTIAVFFPLFFISGIVGKFIASIPFTVIFVLIASIFVALGLVPSLAVWFSKEGEHTKLLERQEEYAQRARAWYAQKLDVLFGNRTYQNRFLWGMIGGFVLALVLPIAGVLQTTFFPAGESPFVYVNIELPPGSTLGQSDLAARAVEEILYSDKNFSSLVTTVGASSAFSNSPQTDPRFANITANIPEDKRKNSQAILQQVRKELSVYTGAIVRASTVSGGPPVGAPVLIKYLGSDSAALDSAVALARAQLEKTPGATAVDSSNKNEATDITLHIDRAKLAQVGLSPAAVAGILRTAVSGAKATSISGKEKDVDVNVYLNLNPAYVDPHDAAAASPSALRQIPVQTPSGTVLLGSLLREELTRSDSVISHEGRQRVVTLTSDVLPGYTPKQVLSSFNARMKKVSMPEGVTIKVGGENEQTNKSFAEMGFALIAGLGLMFIILVLAFNSFRYTIYLLCIVPLSLIGVFMGLAITGQTLSFSSLLGVIALAGVIINHAIILMDSIIQRLNAAQGRAFKEVVIEAATTRLRPIVLTTITTAIGMVPLTYASALWGPLAFAILFGLTFAMLLTLVLVPLLVFRWPGKLPQGVIRS